MNDTYVIGDVHGCYYTLKTLLSQLPKDSRIIFVGDLCDRGLHSAQTIELVKQKGYECVLGNHDYFMYDVGTQLLEERLEDKWWFDEKIGGKQTVASYKRDMDLFRNHIAWLKTLPLYIEINHYFITHAFGLPYYKRRDTKEGRNGLIYNRVSDVDRYGNEWEEDWPSYPVFNVFGHTAYKEPKFAPNYCGIDTGCAYGRKLSALKLGSTNVISVDVDMRDMKKEG